MISTSTKKKRRRTTHVHKRIAAISIRNVDPRHDFWLVSGPMGEPNEPPYKHIEVYGREHVLHAYRRLINLIYASAQ